MNSTNPDVNALVSVARHAALAAGTVVRDRSNGDRTITAKGFRDIVTDTDLAAQAVVTKEIRNAFPNHGFLTEEDDPSLPTSGPVIWIIDPIDGTTNFSRSVPLHCVAIAATIVDKAGCFRPIAAAVYDPLHDELFSAGQGTGAWLNDERIHVSATPRVADAVFAADFGHSDAVRRRTLAQVGRLALEVTTIRAFGSAVLALSWVAAGRLDAYVNNALKPWDLAAGWLLIEEAGGSFRTLDDRNPVLNHGNYACLGSNKILHAPLLARLQS